MKHNLFSVLKPYRLTVTVLALFTLAANAANLAVPKLISNGIDSYGAGDFVMGSVVTWFSLVSFAVFFFTYLQAIAQTYAGERVSRDLRATLADKISGFSFSRLESETPSKLLTNLTSDVDAVKAFVAQAMVIIISSVVLIVGASILLIAIDWKLALAVLAILPLIGIAFALVFKRLGPLFGKAQAIVDRLNATINESILGSALIRVFDSAGVENNKFRIHSGEARDNGLAMLKLFSVIIPFVGLIANLASLIILSLGGHFVIIGDMSLGDFTAFNSYVMLLIFPIIMSGFVSQILSRAQVSYGRIADILALPEEAERGSFEGSIHGDIEARGLTVMYGERPALKNVSLKVLAGTKTAIIGPTAAGKTQLLYALIGLIKTDAGEVRYDNRPISEYAKRGFHSQVAIVFQDSVMFNMTLRENIAFSLSAKQEDVDRAIETAELGEFVRSLPRGLDTVVSERGTSLSGGQKQRIMLARALALNPRVLLLDDFTARVDALTEAKILANIERNYPGVTIVSVTQKVASAEKFDQVMLLMEGEVLAVGTHAELSATSPEYAQIVESQKSTNELHS